LSCARTEGAIAKIHFRDGQYVKKGDLLFELDDAEPRAALRLAQAEVKRRSHAAPGAAAAFPL
jgi:multidrug resistance efflux pump